MKDRVSTKVLDNGAIRYGIYDEAGKLLRYEYIRPEDEPIEEGTPLNKASLLSDATTQAYGLPTSAVPDEALLSARRFTEKTRDDLTAYTDGLHEDSIRYTDETRADMEKEQKIHSVSTFQKMMMGGFR